MTDDDAVAFPPAEFAKQFLAAGEDAAEMQRQWLSQMAEFGGMSGDGLGPTPLQLGTATFKTRVQSNGRISIPEAEREALDIAEGDIVQAVVIPVKRNRE
ncbi:MAG: AbrB/MazE/SpoVT family DNA-binding domain-containing protein [Halobacteriota archaeon]